jgi:hypothetical protein
MSGSKASGKEAAQLLACLSFQQKKIQFRKNSKINGIGIHAFPCRSEMTRAALRDVSNTPKRGLAIQQTKPGAGFGVVKTAHPWCNSLANPSPVFSDRGAIHQQPSTSCSNGQGTMLKFSVMPCENVPPRSLDKDRDPLSLLAPISPSVVASPDGLDMHLQQLQQKNDRAKNETKFRNFRNIPSALSSFFPVSTSPASSFNGTQSALESCIRELDGISDASIVIHPDVK